VPAVNFKRFSADTVGWSNAVCRTRSEGRNTECSTFGKGKRPVAGTPQKNCMGIFKPKTLAMHLTPDGVLDSTAVGVIRT
jgi:hypothetical protein